MDFDELTRKGYFASSLPNIFSTKSFGDWLDPKLSSYFNLKDRSRHCRYNCSKRNGQRRIFSIPNPLAQANTHFFFNKHEGDILKFANSSSNSLSKPEPSDVRCVKITPHALVDHARFKLLSEFKYIVYVDISRFYHSIYTHSLPWAAHGKHASKADSDPDSKAIFFNRIDLIQRNSQDGQTLGIPVGPDSSRVLAEIICAAIDHLFKADNPDAMFLRHVDDVWIGANTESAAKELLHAYRMALLEFELDINETKSKIQSNHLSITDSWPHRMQDLVDSFIELPAKHPTKPNAFLNLIQYSFDTATKKNDEAVVKSLLRRLDEAAIFFGDQEWPYVESFLLQCSLHFPHSIDYVARIVACRHIVGLKINKDTWSRVLHRLLSEHTKLKNDFEVTWALWCCLKSEIKIPADLAVSILEMRCDFAAILVLVLNDKSLIDGKIKTTDCLSWYDLEDTLGANWLLAHEVRIQNWIPASKLKTTNDSDFLKMLRKDSISFIQPDIKPPVFLDDEGKPSISLDDIKSAIEDTYDVYDEDEFLEEDFDISDLL